MFDLRHQVRRQMRHKGVALELRDPAGRQLQAGEDVNNVGDMLERWTGGQLLATPHRVVNATGAAGGRYSIAYFQQPNPDALVAPALPVAPGRPDYTPVLAGQHISRKELGYHTVAALGV
ncbi:hypothetical protein FRACA_380022 [Frankia canadensis]|uniref:Isopenicillin N synthase-like Fe(2+) 2OG dioxygenase domain-containing protein n=1 Tax=Frankia canadensis TaxID=1836972 RepID=A0A2I2KVZ5_9ACTN|nr:2OG-Fe(II) oxygenase family protein [Frankia canadensis]SNQ49831.1 hypothetical protein FRACA_380022 [Frankia canadensis]SOU57121.1 hypothetical protein FRACA_380022 [Frankia canadensis]